MNSLSSHRHASAGSVRRHLQGGDSLEMLRIVRDQGEVVVQGSGLAPRTFTVTNRAQFSARHMIQSARGAAIIVGE